MSLLFAQMSPRGIVMVSDDYVSPNACYKTFPKIQVFRSNKGLPILIGAVGHLSPIHLLFCVQQKMLAETGAELGSLMESLPGDIRFMLAGRPTSEVNPERDIKFPPVSLFVAGFDATEGRLRARLIANTGQGSGVVRDFAPTDFGALGYLTAEDHVRLLAFDKTMKETAAHLSAENTARQMASKMTSIASTHPEHVCKPAFFAALDGRGSLVSLPEDLPLPWNVFDAASQAGSTHAVAPAGGTIWAR